MKTKMLLIIITLLPFTLLGDVVVQDANNVIIAGENVGKVVDACANYPAKRSEIQDALATYFQAQVDRAAAAEKQLADTRSFIAQMVSRAKQAIAKRNLAEISGVVSETEAPEVERKRKALEVEKSEIEAKIAELK